MVKNEKVSYSSMNQAACAAQFLFQTVLGHGHISTTGRYLHLISPQFRPPKELNPLDLLGALPPY